MSNAWRDRGTRCGSFIFIFSAGMFHSAVSRSISDHSAVVVPRVGQRAGAKLHGTLDHERAFIAIYGAE